MPCEVAVQLLIMNTEECKRLRLLSHLRIRILLLTQLADSLFVFLKQCISSEAKASYRSYFSARYKRTPMELYFCCISPLSSLSLKIPLISDS